MRALLLAALAAPLRAADPTTKTIAPGVEMPVLNLGTCCGSKPSVGLPSWLAAGGVGIDTANDYGDQNVIGGILNPFLAAQGRSRSVRPSPPSSAHGCSPPLTPAAGLRTTSSRPRCRPASAGRPPARPTPPSR